jgi:hypothetical protein
MRHKRQGPRWWNVWLPILLLFLVGGLLVLEPQAPLSPGGHKIAQMAIALLMYGLVTCWVWCNRVALILESLFEKYQAASRLSIKRVIATYTNVSLVVGNSS